MSAQYTPCDADHHDNVDTFCSEYATSCGWHVPCGSAVCHTWSGKVHSLVSPSSARRRSWTCTPRQKTRLSNNIQPWSNEAIGGATFLPSFKLQSVGAQKNHCVNDESKNVHMLEDPNCGPERFAAAPRSNAPRGSGTPPARLSTSWQRLHECHRQQNRVRRIGRQSQTPIHGSVWSGSRKR